PPLLVVCDLERFEIHTNFTGTPKKVYAFTLQDLLKPDTLELLRNVFTNPDVLNPKHQRERITQDASAQIGDIALRLRDRGHDPDHVAQFMMQMVFALFAEDVALIPNKLVTRILEKTKDNPERAHVYIQQLFEAMATGGEILLEDVPYFNGGLFEQPDALPLEPADLDILYQAATLDWSEVEPAIFGTLFERSLDPSKRSQLGAHYTSREDILRIVQPVIIDPLRGEWQNVRESIEAYLASTLAPDSSALSPQKLRSELKKRDTQTLKPIVEYLEKLRNLRVLDPACGSGNFLYVALQQLKELEQDVLTFSQSIGLPQAPFISPKQFYGIEVNVFASALASMVVWIGYLQWNRANGYSNRQTPILDKLDNIKHHDALMNADGSEYNWPQAEFIIGNPPFLGDKKMRQELGDDYTIALRKLFKGRLPGQSDFVCYWFEKARALIEDGTTKRAGLISTNSIRGGANRKVLERIKDSGDIFMAWNDEPWVLDGAAVRVSIVGFDDAAQTAKNLDGTNVQRINSDLTSTIDVNAALKLNENANTAFQGPVKVGSFDISEEVAKNWLNFPNPSGHNNSDVLKPWTNGMDITRKPSNKWIIDFGLMTLEEAENYLLPLEYVRENIKPARDKNRDVQRKTFWWRLGRSGQDMKDELCKLQRFICTPRVSKHRLFVWLDAKTLPDSATVAIAVDDDFTFGVLHSSFHEYWALRQGTSLGKGNDPRYTPSTCFETFPFPTPTPDQHANVSKWAKYLDDVRNQLLAADDTLTMTKLYNKVVDLRETRDSSARAYPLLLAHEKLDAAVAAAYGWDWPLSEEDILERLLALNLERAAQQG
ncbi:MAG: DNA methyltransferase, partial [Deinococcota bacterium]